MSKTAIKRTRQKADSIRSDETPQTSQNLSNAGNNQPPEQAATEKGGIREFLKDQQVYVNSIASGLLGLPNGSVLREMGKSRSDMIQFYMSEGGGNKSIEEAIKTVNGPEDEEYVDKLLKDLMSLPVTMVSWYGMEHLHSRAPGIAKAVWQFVKGEARREFESGHRAAQVFEPVDWM